MMKNICELPANTAHKISMGQVVASVFSVVKELVENALDAGASSVDVRLDDFGLDKIEVRDNGSGVAPGDAAVMGLAHYTSKIHCFDDLRTLGSFGFRGEALSAVCASCRVTVATRTADEHVGRLLTLDTSGRVTEQQPVARAPGTTVTAAQLFCRQPVRRQLYSCARRRRDQLRAVESLLVATAISRPQLRLALHHNGSQLLTKAPCDSMKSSAVQVLRSEVARMLQRLLLTDDLVRIEVLLPPVDASVKVSGRTSNDQCFVLVNGRTVSHKPVEKVLSRMYSSRHGLSSARYPVSVVQITVSADQLDVNLEPNKTSVGLLCESKILELLEEGLTKFYHVESTPTTTSSGSLNPEAISPEPDIKGPSAGLPPVEKTVSASVVTNVQLNGAPSCEALSAIQVCGFHSKPLSPASGEPAPIQPPTCLNGAEPADWSPGVSDGPVTATAGVEPPADPLGTGPVVARDTSNESLFGENFQGVSLAADSEVELFEPTPSGLDTAWEDAEERVPDHSGVKDMGPGHRGVQERVPGHRGVQEMGPGHSGVQEMGPDHSGASEQHPVSEGSWAGGTLQDSQGNMIQPTSLVTSYSGDRIPDWVRRPPTAAVAAASSPAVAMVTAGAESSSVTGASPRQRPVVNDANQPSITLWTTSVKAEQPTLASEACRVGSEKNSEASKRPADPSEEPPAIREKPPPAKRTKQNDMEYEYEPVASQVVRSASNAFSFYCRDMRRKYLSLDPTMPLGLLSAALADGWRAALPAVRRQFELRAREDQLRYQEDVRKAQLCEQLAPPARTVAAGGSVMTQLRRLVAPLTPEAGARRHRPRRRRSAALSVSGLEGQVAALEAALTRPRRQAAGADDLRLLGPLESHQAWVLLQSDQLLLVNPLRLCEVATLSRLLATYRFPWRPLPEPRVITADTVGEEQYSSLQSLARDGARVVDERVLANGFCVEVVGETARVTGLADCINLYGVKDLAELLQKISADPTTSLAQCRPLRAVSWLQAEAVRVSRGDGARMSAEEVLSLVTSAPDLAGQCFHQRPLAAPLYRLPAA